MNTNDESSIWFQIWAGVAAIAGIVNIRNVINTPKEVKKLKKIISDQDMKIAEQNLLISNQLELIGKLMRNER